VTSAGLVRTLRTRDLVLIVIGTVIGSGIFIVPGDVMRQTGGAVGLSLLVWVVGGVLSLLGALTYAELGASRPDAGGLYVYLKDAFGPAAGFLYGWTAFFVIGSGSVATLAVAFTRYAREFVPLGGFEAKLLAVAVIAVVATINVLGTRRGADVQNWSTAIKAGAIVVMSALLLAARPDEAAPAPAVPAPESLVAGLGLAMVGVLWAYEGWTYVTFSAGETTDPQRMLPRGLIFATACVMGIYLLANVAYVAALGAAGVAAGERVAAEAVGAVAGPSAGKAIAAVILVSMFSAANGVTLTVPRMYYAMARDRIFFARLAAVHPRFHTPAFAIIASSAWAAVLAASGTFEQLLTYVVSVSWAFYALGALAVFRYRRDPAVPRPFRAPGYPAAPLLFALTAGAIVVNTVLAQPRETLAGVGIVALGVPAYLLWRRRGSS
jgi:APA family basic amino acid/polyamine antiporter